MIISTWHYVANGPLLLKFEPCYKMYMSQYCNLVEYRVHAFILFDICFGLAIVGKKVQTG